MNAISTDFIRHPDEQPDAQALTAELRRGLERAAAELRSLDVPQAAALALEVTTLRNVVSSPLGSYDELPQLDSAVLAALSKLPDLCRHAPEAEVTQALKTLRRILLSDRRRIDPDPRRQSLSLAVCIRQLWLIGHRSDLLRSRVEWSEAQRLLAVVSPEDPRHDALQEHCSLLKTYCETQEAYCSSVQREMQQLQAELRS